MSDVKERPILFSAPMVRAILEGRKTQTRRAVKPQPSIDAQGNFCWNGSNFGQDGRGPRVQAIASPLPSSGTKRVHCPYGKPGDRLWVRETWQGPLIEDDLGAAELPANEYERPEFCQYAADGGPTPEYMTPNDELVCRWRPSIHMPRWAGRILLEVTAVRVERLQDISEADAQAEGARRFLDIPTGTPSAHPNRWSMESPSDTDECLSTARYAFANLFCKVNGKGKRGALDFEPWDANPWVWVIEFRRVEQ